MKTKTHGHHSGARHARKSKRSMEVFANLRENIRHLRRVNADLLEAAKDAVDGNMDSWATVKDALRAAITKATGKIK